jgi:alpha-L-rhamnosidase
MSIEDPRTEYLSNPSALDTVKPRFSWRLSAGPRGAAQSGYQILVASAPGRLARDEGDLWDSGEVKGPASNQIAYAGSPLQSRLAAWWKVRVWDEAGRISAWSQPARFSVGLLVPSDWTAEWISVADPAPVHSSRKKLHLPPARHYRREFRACCPKGRSAGLRRKE